MRKLLLVLGLAVVLAGAAARYLLAARQRASCSAPGPHAQSVPLDGEARRHGARGARRTRDARRAGRPARGRAVPARARLAADQDRALRNSGAGQPAGNPAPAVRRARGARNAHRHRRLDVRRHAPRGRSASADQGDAARQGNRRDHERHRPRGRTSRRALLPRHLSLRRRAPPIAICTRSRIARWPRRSKPRGARAPRRCRSRTPTKRSRWRRSWRRRPGSPANGRASPACSPRACGETCGCRPIPR